jgi:MoaA/NifB/PqqE/SkfB family radical SAM enzyme
MKNDLTWGESLKTFGVKQVISYIDKNPEKNVPRILDWLIKTDKNNVVSHQAEAIQQAFADPDNNWHRLILSLWSDIDDGVRRRLFENFVINASMIGSPRQIKIRETENCNVPWAILLDPTSACNLHCIGCWAADYGSKMNMSFAQMDDIVRQGKAMGTYFYIFSGGEPLVRKKDVIALCEAHPDCAFLSFTNGTLIDEAFADEMLRVQNFVPAISVEGFEEATDSRRGKGTYAAVVRAMEILKRKKLPFGISCCYTRANTDVIGSEAYFDEMIRLGAKFMWLFTYMPVGKDAVTDLMVTPEQREFMYHQVRAFRKTKPIFTMDFWNDGEFVGGCIAGGRSYLHINANGDIEPCAFIHYSDSSIYNKTLLEAYRSPLFMQYHDSQPFNKNHLRPCPLLDNPEFLARMVDCSGAASTDMQSREDVHDLTAKCKHAAKCWAPVADRLWSEGHVEHHMKR